MKIGDSVRVTVYRFDPDRDAAPRYETFEVPYERSMRILDALEYIRSQLGESLDVRWLCSTRKCGACGVLVNGVPRLACWDAVEAEMTVEPLPGFPVLRDLVVDRTGYQETVNELQPCLSRTAPYAGFPEPLAHGALQSIYPLYLCSECNLCVAACPSYRQDTAGGFPGPRALVQLARTALDPRDGLDRGALLENVRVFDCMTCYRCETVCPEDIPIVEAAVEPIKRLSLQQQRSNYHFVEVFHQNIRENGLVDSKTLFRSTKGLGAWRDLRRALVMAKRGKLSARTTRSREAARALERLSADAEERR